ncbi:hypothetical protein MF271_22510 (plasmid) [Deinococcus sp. KNUC1210]|uniref:hypothetical protein n=1 Tax=Deinococcus sp. KNUC1210 TaxID=2917691 RepID=UPI001EF043BF|nr:hypothetical protein [Deinococcus sp. KNUC1210]ULH18241.1 hypothetical protein MF271_22510 [Deinococcus sp. KNUC1210]
MPYIKLSQQIEKLYNPQRSDAFVKQVRAAVREGEFDAGDLPERFTLPKAFSKRGGGESYSKSVRDMVIDATPEFEAWFERINRELTPARTGGKIHTTVENIEAGLVDFKTLAEQTRQKMTASYTKGQQLGNGRANAKAKAPAKKTPVKRK